MHLAVPSLSEGEAWAGFGACIPPSWLHSSRLRFTDVTVTLRHSPGGRSPSSSPRDPARRLDFDPISLREPPGLHDWAWLGLPHRMLRLFVHKTVLEVRA